MNNKNENTEKKNQTHDIKIAILAEEPLGWGSGKHFFQTILQNYTWTIHQNTYTFKVKYVFDKDIVEGNLNTSEFDVLLVPGGGVGDGHAVMKGFLLLNKVKKWKKNISNFIKNGGGYVGICGGTALITDLKTENNKLQSFLEKQYNKSSLGISCVSSYYKSIALPIFYPFQRNYPEKIGALAYVFSFSPGETVDGLRIHSGGIPLDFQLDRRHPIFSNFNKDVERLRWWGGPTLILPEKPDRFVEVIAKYPSLDKMNNEQIRIHAWRYIGGIHGLFIAFQKALQYIKKENDKLKNVFLYTFYMAGDWELTDRSIELDFSDKPSITAEIYPNSNQGRIILCTTHPEYMIWQKGHIVEKKNKDFTCLATGLYKWEGIAPLSENAKDELTHTWWMVRRFVAWASKVPDDHLPPIQKEEFTENDKSILKNVFWDGTLRNQMENI